MNNSEPVLTDVYQFSPGETCSNEVTPLPVRQRTSRRLCRCEAVSEHGKRPAHSQYGVRRAQMMGVEMMSLSMTNLPAFDKAAPGMRNADEAFYLKEIFSNP
ncbi:hypothetical protein PQR05_04555 [Paraburkholderia sediminicola]|uniref:hypothetical protein n=1 Tax=Paraburkholderia sediminicola TaxID=458836 RepID=UPI0038BD867B